MRIWAGFAGLAIAVSLALTLSGYSAFLIGLIAITTIACVGLNILLGLAGEVSLGQAGFLALGAYSVGVLTTKVGLPFFAAWFLSIILVAAVAAVVALPALRVSGPYLAMITIAFGFIVEAAATEWQTVTGGSVGISDIGSPFGVGGTAAMACVCASVMLFGFSWLKKSPLGLAMICTAQAPNAARSVGIEALPVRAAAFVLAATAGGVAGGLQAALTGFLAPSSFPFSQSILFLLVVMVGGVGSPVGPLIGAFLVGLLPEFLSSLAEYRQLVFGAALLVVLWIAPRGIVGLFNTRQTNEPVARGDVVGYLRAGAGGALTAKELSVAFGGVKAVDGVDLRLQPGCVTGVIGPNGAGKTTLLNALTGFVTPNTGTIVADGRIARSFQTAQMPPDMTVLDCVRLGLLRGRWRGNADANFAAALLKFVGYTNTLSALAGTLPHPDRRLVEIARALATQPSVLVLDEPAAGLDASDTERLGPVLRNIAACGLAVALVEHDMALVMGVCDTLVVLDTGRVIATGTPVDIRSNAQVRAAYLGSGSTHAIRQGVKTSETLLNVVRLNAGYGGVDVLCDIDLAVARGEMVALIGPNGAGKSTLMRSLSGLLRPVKGHVEFDGEDLAASPAHKVARAGLVLVPEGRQVFPQLTVAENLRLGATARHDFTLDEVAGILERFPRLKPLIDRPAGFLSGGEQQMLALGRGLLAKPRLLLLDEPSLGLAPAVAQELFAALSRLRDEGLTLVLVDQMTELALPLADRCALLEGGQIRHIGTTAEMAAKLDYLKGDAA
ncbi:MAG: ATP-binding cassette domain-containing protein [Beijerinckiaceae bacterium]|nr:ATP-binding cassette domain-containing protein [Beijerinckiaceae bacterium]